MRRSLVALLFFAVPLLPGCVTDSTEDATAQSLQLGDPGGSTSSCGLSACHGQDRAGGALFVAGDGGELDDCPHLELHDALVARDGAAIGIQCDHCHDTDDGN